MPCPTARPSDVVVGQASLFPQVLGGFFWHGPGLFGSRGRLGSADPNGSCFGSSVVKGGRENDQSRLVTSWCSRLWHQREHLGVSTGRSWDRDGSVVAWVYGCARSVLDQVPRLAGAATTAGCDGAAIAMSLCCCWLFSRNPTGIGFSWTWAMLLCHCWLDFYFIVLIGFFWLVLCTFILVCSFMLRINPYTYLVGLGWVYPGLHTQCALSGLAGCRTIILIKWTQPPSGRMKHRATGISGWLHSRKVALISNLWPYFGMVFPICRLSCKADGIANCAIPAKWCLLEYMNFVETPAIIARGSLDEYCNLGFRHYVPPCIHLFH